MKLLPLAPVGLLALLGVVWGMAPAVAAPAFNQSWLEAKTPPPGAIWLESLEVQNILQSVGEPKIGHAMDDKPLSLDGKVYEHGMGLQSRAVFKLALNGGATRFVSRFGMDDGVGKLGSVSLRATVDGVLRYDGAVVRGGDPSQLIDLDLRGAKTLTFEVLEVEVIDYDHADFAGALLFLTPQAVKGDAALKPHVAPPPPRPSLSLPVLLPTPDKPQINGARVVGVSPGKPFLHLIPATGKAPLTFSARNLPEGLQLDAKTGIISGKIARAGTYRVTASAKNALGTTSSLLRIECAPGKMMLTPLLGWNCWSVFGEDVTAKDVAEQADWLVESGLAARGWNTIIVDDTWQSHRDADGTIGSNKRFGSMKALVAYVHGLGLKFGLLSAATPKTCSGFAGSTGWEEKDAALYARWGIDLLKYDWCPESGNKNGVTPDAVIPAYQKMRAALDKTDRDIALSMVTYGFGGGAGAIGKAVGAQTWRTVDVLTEGWEPVRRAALGQRDNAGFVAPGHWNDWGPIYTGRFTPRNPHFSNLTADEQKFQITAWAMGASALVLGCDLSQLDPNRFYRIATPLLTNTDLIAIQQDELGKPATVLPTMAPEGSATVVVPPPVDPTKPAPEVGPTPVQIWTRPLADGTLAVAVLNANDSGYNQHALFSATDLKLASLGMTGPQPVRDVWAGHQVALLGDKPFECVLPRHSAALYIIGKPTR